MFRYKQNIKKNMQCNPIHFRLIYLLFLYKISSSLGATDAFAYNSDKSCSCPEKCVRPWTYYDKDEGKWLHDLSVNVTCSKY